MNHVSRNHPYVVNFCLTVREHLARQGTELTEGVARHFVAGLLDALWEFTSLYAPAGDVGRFSDADLATAVEWPHEAGELVEMLVAAGLLLRSEPHRLIVADWSQRADAACHQFVADQGIAFADGEPANRKPRRSSKAGRQSSMAAPAVR
ncbi:MAG: hypothetical protein WD030_05540, partial [Pirellulales bacterium]